MTDPNTTPIIVNPGQSMDQFGVALRYAIQTLGGYLAAKGYVDGDFVQVLLAIATLLGPYAYAAYKSYQQKKALVMIATAAPNTVAIVKEAP
jgi:hypothetical protein